MDDDGRGWVRTKELKTQAELQFKVSRRTADRCVAKAAAKGMINVAATRHNSTGYTGFKRFIRENNVPVLTKAAIDVTLEDLQDLTAFRALCATSFVADATTVSRSVIKEHTGVSVPTQIKYEKLLGVGKQVNYAIVDDYSDWAKGHYNDWHTFRFMDYKGVLGTANTAYLARQLPNTYDHPKDVKQCEELRIRWDLVDFSTRVFFNDPEVWPQQTDTDAFVILRNGWYATVPAYNRDATL